MGLEPQQLVRTSDALPSIDPSFIPTCPGCRYDLRGIGDGVCPECGEPFAVAALYEAAQLAARERSTGRMVSPHSLLVLCALLTFPCSPALAQAQVRSSEYGVVLAWLLIIWLCFGWWAVRARAQIFGGRSWLQPVLVYPIALGPFLFFTSSPPEPNLGPWVVSVAGTIFLGAVWWSVRPRKVWAPVLWCGVHMLTPGVILVAAAGGWQPQRSPPGPVVDPRIGQIYRQYPIAPGEALAFGAVFVALGLILMAVAIGCLFRRTEIGPGDVGAAGPAAIG